MIRAICRDEDLQVQLVSIATALFVGLPGVGMFLFGIWPILLGLDHRIWQLVLFGAILMSAGAGMVVLTRLILRSNELILTQRQEDRVWKKRLGQPVGASVKWVTEDP